MQTRKDGVPSRRTPTRTATATINGRTAILTEAPVIGRRLICIDKTGKMRFNGPINTPEEQSQVPKEFQDLLHAVIDSQKAPGRRPPAPRPSQSAPAF